MRNILVVYLFLLAGISGFAQAKFQKGYFIDNSGKKVEALIQNELWTTNPSNFNYKFAENGNTLTATVENTQEFGIYKRFKYIKAEFKIDDASDNEDELSTNKTPNYSNKTGFLKVLVEGDQLKLYEYLSAKQQRFYYQKGLKPIVLLSYHKYKNSNGEIRVNSAYKGQLSTNVITNCATIDISYSKAQLGNYVKSYNNCNKVDETLVDFREYELRGDWNFKLKAGLNLADISVLNRSGGSSGNVNGTFIRFGLEIEHFLSFESKNWSFFLEPTFSSFNDDSIDLEYSSIEIPIGLRNYIRVSDNSFIFINAGVSIDMAGNAKSGNDPLETGIAAFYGAGYSVNKKFSLELRNYTNRSLSSGDNNLLEADMSNLAIVLGYTF